MRTSSLQHTTFTIRPVPPYDFHLTADYATHFQGRYLWEFYEDGVYHRALASGDSLISAKIRSTGAVESPELEVSIAGMQLTDQTVTAIKKQVEWIFQTNADLSPFYRMANDDPFLKPLLNSRRGFHIPQDPSILEGLVYAILGQQISNQVALVLRWGLTKTYGESLSVEGVEYHLFPRAQKLVEAGIEGLRSQKLSSRKAEYIIDIAEKIVSGELNLDELYSKSDETVVSELTALRGVGEWTAHWLLLRTLGRLDGFPHGDLALQRSLATMIDKGTRMTGPEALEYSLKWSPYRAYVTAYIFSAIRSGRLTIT
jgi:DNA-3-methyladenine glycosylase II